MRTTWGVLCRTQEEAETVLAFLRLWTAAAGLTLHPTQTRLVHAAEAGSDFLSGHFGGGQQWRRNKSLQRLQEKLRLRRKRSPGRSLSEIIAQVNLILRGWHGYFRESHWRGLRRADGWLGRRLGAILRKREERPGNGLKSSRQPAVAEAVVCGAVAVESGTRLLGLRFVSRSCHGLESRMRENGSSGSGGKGGARPAILALSCAAATSKRRLQTGAAFAAELVGGRQKTGNCPTGGRFASKGYKVFEQPSPFPTLCAGQSRVGTLRGHSFLRGFLSRALPKCAPGRQDQFLYSRK